MQPPWLGVLHNNFTLALLPSLLSSFTTQLLTAKLLAVSFAWEFRSGLRWKHVHPPCPSQDDSGIPAFCFSQHLCWYYWPSPLFSKCCDVLGIVLYWYLLLYCMHSRHANISWNGFLADPSCLWPWKSRYCDWCLIFPITAPGGLMWRWDPQIPSWE